MKGGEGNQRRPRHRQGSHRGPGEARKAKECRRGGRERRGGEGSRGEPKGRRPARGERRRPDGVIIEDLQPDQVLLLGAAAAVNKREGFSLSRLTEG